jgi:hypothetical protein
MIVISSNVVQVKLKDVKDTLNKNSWDYNKRKFYLWLILGNKCKDCGTSAYRRDGSHKKMDIHHLVYTYGFNPNWTKQWKNCSTYHFKKFIVPEVRECCILLCRACHRKRHGLYKKRGK